MLHFGAANRDPMRWSDPDTFDLRRTRQDHVGFGSGIHFCLGSHLARVELCALLEELVHRVERIELVGRPVWRQNALLRGLESLPVRFQRASA
jgi:cytochrome P450